MKKIIFIFLFLPIFSFAQVKNEESSHWRYGDNTVSKVDTFKARLLIATGITLSDKRKVYGYVILKETPKGCRRIGFLTIEKIPFPRRFELIDYELYN